jgi:hypothetical protein
MGSVVSDRLVVVVQKKDVTKGRASNYVATDPSHGGTQPARKGADRTNSIPVVVVLHGVCCFRP